MTVSVLKTTAHRVDYRNKKLEPKSGLLHDLLNEEQPEDVSRMIFVVPRDHYAKCPSDCQQHLLKNWAWPEYFFTNACHESNGYVQEIVLNAGQPDEKSIKHLRCLVKQIFTNPGADGKTEISYDWYEMTISIRQSSNGSVSIICFGVPKEFETTFATALDKVNQDPQWKSDGERVVAALMSEVVRLYDQSVWSISKAIREVEKGRAGNSDFEFMHELLRHTIHTTEVLEVTGASLEELSSSSYTKRNPPSNTTQGSIKAGERVLAQYQFWFRLLQNFMRRSKSNELRLQNEIHLALNLVAQRDSAATLVISHAAQKDSAAMRTISIVTLLFLPATFVAGLFGMSFFNYDQDKGWSQNSEIWIFWVVAGVLTLVTLLIYGLSQYYISRKQKQKFLRRTTTRMSA